MWNLMAKPLAISILTRFLIPYKCICIYQLENISFRQKDVLNYFSNNTLNPLEVFHDNVMHFN